MHLCVLCIDKSSVKIDLRIIVNNSSHSYTISPLVSHTRHLTTRTHIISAAVSHIHMLSHHRPSTHSLTPVILPRVIHTLVISPPNSTSLTANQSQTHHVFQTIEYSIATKLVCDLSLLSCVTGEKDDDDHNPEQQHAEQS